MSNLIALNSSHYNSQTNEFVYRFPTQQRFEVGDVIGVKSVNLFNSFFNVDATLGNQVRIDWPSGESDFISHIIDIPNGFYTGSSFNSILQKEMYDRHLYVETSSTQLNYYLSLNTSTTQYANYVRTYAVPTDVTPPDDATWSQLTTKARSPKIFFGKVGPRFGFASEDTFTTAQGYTEDYTYDAYSTQVPQVNPFNSLIFTNSMVNNRGLANPARFLYSIGLNASFGSLVSSGDHEILYNSVEPGQYTDFTIQLLSNELVPLTLLDNNVLILLSIIKKNK